jgi:hypothetical protein
MPFEIGISHGSRITRLGSPAASSFQSAVTPGLPIHQGPGDGASPGQENRPGL